MGKLLDHLIKLCDSSKRESTKKVISVDGDEECTVYVYDEKPLAAIRKGQEFYVDVLPRDTALRSRSTGAVTNTREMKCAALSYNGTVFGSTSFSLNVLKDMRNSGFEFKLKVKKTGMYSRSVPELVSMTVEPRLINLWWSMRNESHEDIPLDIELIEKERESRNASIKSERIAKRLGVRRGSFDKELRFYVDKSWPANVTFPRTKRSFVPSFEIVPPKRGSKAKPHIDVYEGNTVLFSVSARHGDKYREMLELLDKPCTAVLIADFYQDGDLDNKMLFLLFKVEGEQ